MNIETLIKRIIMEYSLSKNNEERERCLTIATNLKNILDEMGIEYDNEFNEFCSRRENMDERIAIAIANRKSNLSSKVSIYEVVANMCINNILEKIELIEETTETARIITNISLPYDEYPSAKDINLSVLTNNIVDKLSSSNRIVAYRDLNDTEKFIHRKGILWWRKITSTEIQVVIKIKILGE